MLRLRLQSWENKHPTATEHIDSTGPCSDRIHSACILLYWPLPREGCSLFLVPASLFLRFPTQPEAPLHIFRECVLPATVAGNARSRQVTQTRTLDPACTVVPIFLMMYWKKLWESRRWLAFYSTSDLVERDLVQQNWLVDSFGIKYPVLWLLPDRDQHRLLQSRIIWRPLVFDSRSCLAWCCIG